MYDTEVPKSIRGGYIRRRHYLGPGFKARLERLGFKVRWDEHYRLDVYCEEDGYWYKPTYLQLFSYFKGEVKDFCFGEPLDEDDLLLLDEELEEEDDGGAE